MKRVAYLGWLGAGNLGDEGCYQLFRRCVHSISTQVTCVPITIREVEGKLFSYQPDVGPRSRTEWNPAAYDYVVLGGGSLLNAERYVEALRVAQRAGVPTAIWGTGFDGLPHKLIDPVAGGLIDPLTKGPVDSDTDGPPDSIAARVDALSPVEGGVPSTHPSIAEVFRGCRVAGVRGPVTAGWLRANGCELPLVSGDPGLLFDPRLSDPPPPRDQVTVIWGMSKRATFEGPSHEALTRRLARWLQGLARRYRLVVCTIWAHDIPAAKQLAQHIGEGAQLKQEPLTLKTFAEAMSQTAWTLSYRLHGCILSAACGVPFCSIAYRSKCYDFAFSIDAGEWVVDPASSHFEPRLDSVLTGVSGPQGVSFPDRSKRHALQHRTSLLEIVKTIICEMDEGQSCQTVSPR